jgi:hypothetical protein
VGMIALLIGGLSGCGAAGIDAAGGDHLASTSVSQGSASISDHAVPLILMHDPAPSLLDVSLSVSITQQSSDAEPRIAVGLGFDSGGKGVQFAGDERVSCAGVALALKNRAATFEVFDAPASQATGTVLHCEYTAGTMNAGIALEIPQAPAIISPAAGAHVPRSSRTIVTYHVDPATSSAPGIVALAPSSPSPKALARVNVPRPMQAVVDTSGFAPGQGTLALTTTLSPRVTSTGAAFKSVRADGTAMVGVAVTWS